MANYYVSNTGDDDADGLTPATAWETLTKVNGFAYTSGDIISFECGSEWAGGINISQSITANSYGTGEKPKLTIANFSIGFTANTTYNYILDNLYFTTSAQAFGIINSAFNGVFDCDFTLTNCKFEGFIIIVKADCSTNSIFNCTDCEFILGANCFGLNLLFTNNLTPAVIRRCTFIYTATSVYGIRCDNTKTGRVYVYGCKFICSNNFGRGISGDFAELEASSNIFIGLERGIDNGNNITSAIAQNNVFLDCTYGYYTNNRACTINNCAFINCITGGIGFDAVSTITYNISTDGTLPATNNIENVNPLHFYYSATETDVNFMRPIKNTLSNDKGTANTIYSQDYAGDSWQTNSIGCYTGEAGFTNYNITNNFFNLSF